MIALSQSELLAAPCNKSLAGCLLVICLLALPTQGWAQGWCTSDGIPISFDTRRGAVELDDVKVKEVIGTKDDDFDVNLGASSVQPVNFSAGSLRVTTLSATAFPDNGVRTNQIDRSENRVWSTEYPKGMYEFANKNDLQVDIQISVISGQATHVTGGSASSVSVSVANAGVSPRWHGGKTNSLKSLEGDLNIHYWNLQLLTLEGIHRATIDVCVTIRGNI